MNIVHHPLCATRKGWEYFCDCRLWDGTSRFPVDPYPFSYLDDINPQFASYIIWDWHVLPPSPWWYRLYLKLWWFPVVEPVKILWWKLTGQWGEK